MVKEVKETVTKYKCDRCGEEYTEEEQAENCENRGTRDSIEIHKTFLASSGHYIFFKLASGSPDDSFATATLRCEKVINSKTVEHSHYWLPVIMHNNKELILKPLGFVPNDEVNCYIDFSIDEYKAKKIIELLEEAMKSNPPKHRDW